MVTSPLIEEDSGMGKSILLSQMSFYVHNLIKLYIEILALRTLINKKIVMGKLPVK